MSYRGSGFMQEHKLSVIFEPSYTLDALNFLDHLFIPRSLPNEQMVCYFEEYLGDYHEKILQNIRKNLIKTCQPKSCQKSNIDSKNYLSDGWCPLTSPPPSLRLCPNAR